MAEHFKVCPTCQGAGEVPVPVEESRPAAGVDRLMASSAWSGTIDWPGQHHPSEWFWECDHAHEFSHEALECARRKQADLIKEHADV